MTAFESVLPPRKRDWAPGQTQIGLFLRFPDGEKIEITVHAGTDPEVAAAVELLRALTTQGRLRPQETPR